ncbi:hypothetical protein CF651_16195 [Paenibacillus rigui]|uniref:Uncharacterized protein n=1 Tax=Paenibacillus rigui TaxID=554312 RepID=A0A229UNW8_9BACL|nr:hypothetical protein CF651_16195 [Paenibacillus rigui]
MFQERKVRLNDTVGIIIALFLGIGVVFLRMSKGDSRRWIGYALVVMSFLLIAFVVIARMSQSSHGYGH